MPETQTGEVTTAVAKARKKRKRMPGICPAFLTQSYAEFLQCAGRGCC